MLRYFRDNVFRDIDMFVTAIPQPFIVRLSIACLALLSFTLVIPNDGYVAHAQNNSILKAGRVSISPDLRAKMRNISGHRNVTARAELAQNLADQINGNRLRSMRSDQIEKILSKSLNNMIQNDMRQIQNILSQLMAMQHEFKDLAMNSGGSMEESYYTPGGSQYIVHTWGTDGWHTFLTYEKDNDGVYRMKQIDSFHRDSKGNKKQKSKSDGNNSEPDYELLDNASNNPDGTSKDSIIAETEARMLVPKLVSVNGNLSSLEAYLFSYLVTSGLMR